MARAKKRWVYTPPKPPKAPKPKVPDFVKEELEERAQTLIETVLKPTYIKPPPPNMTLNYITDIYAKWYRQYFYFCATYACPGPHAISPSFETKFARLEYLANGKFRMSFMRHTEQWWPLDFEVTLEEALEWVQGGGHFHP